MKFESYSIKKTIPADAFMCFEIEWISDMNNACSLKKEYRLKLKKRLESKRAGLTEEQSRVALLELDLNEGEYSADTVN